MLECSEENGALFARIIVETNLGLETKIYKVSMCKVKDVQEILPYRRRNMQSRVKAQSHHIPDERVTVAILSTSGGGDRGDMVEGGEEAGENFHHGPADIGVA
jgi:hypothetical protein